MRTGIPREEHDQEHRVSCLPDGVAALTLAGHEVLVEPGAGAGVGVQDGQFTAAGAKLAHPDDVWAAADLVPKVRTPVSAEYPKLRRGQIVFGYLHLAASADCTRAFLDSGAVAMGVTHQGRVQTIAASTLDIEDACVRADLRSAAPGWRAAAGGDRAIARGVNAAEGVVTCLPVGRAHGQRTASLRELLAA